MNRIDTSHSSEGQPFLAPLSLDHVQNAARDITALQAIALIGPDYDDAKAYIIWGVDQTTPGGLPTFTEGAILYGREIYYVSAHNIPTITVGQVPVMVLGISYPGGDPTLFATGASYSIHQIRKMSFVAATAGTGLADYANCLRMLRPPYQEIATGTPLGYTVAFDRNKWVAFTSPASASTNTISTSFTNARPGCVVWLHIVASTSGRVLDFGGAPVITGSTLLTSPSAGHWRVRLTCEEATHAVVEVFFTLV
jgi:hypothetical protein